MDEEILERNPYTKSYWQLICPNGQTDTFYRSPHGGSIIISDLNESFPDIESKLLKLLQIASMFSNILEFNKALKKANYKISQIIAPKSSNLRFMSEFAISFHAQEQMLNRGIDESIVS
jgi:hypothetical protein